MQADEPRLGPALSDRLILTTSGFRGMPPIRHSASILAGSPGATSRTRVEVILNRRRAFERGISLAAAGGDVIAIPGRGALTHVRPDPRGAARRFDDRDVARDAIREATLRPMRAPSFPNR